MNITAVSGLTGFAGNQTAAQGATDATSAFKDILGGMIDNVNQTDAALQSDIVRAAAGELDNPEQLAIDSSKAQIALQLVMSVRNNAMEAYNDIIKMQV